MVLYAPHRIRKLKEEGHRQVIAEIREHDSKLVAWHSRMKEAHTNGQPFDEPPPELPEHLRDLIHVQPGSHSQRNGG